MGIGMPKFITDGYSTFKERCHDIREGFRVVKMVFTLARKIDVSKSADPTNPQAFLDALRNTDALPESFQNLLSNVSNDELKKMMEVAKDVFAKKDGNKNGRSSVSETITKMADVLAEADRRKELDKNNAALDEIENAAKEQAKYMYENKYDEHSSKNPGESSSTQSSASMFDRLDKSGLDRMIDAALEQPDNNSPDSESREDSSSKVRQDESSSKDKDQTNEPDFIPSDTYKNIMGMNKKVDSNSDIPGGSNFRTAREYQESSKRTFQQDSMATPGPTEKKLPPLTKMLGEELNKRFGANWRSRMPPFMRNPNLGEIPDLGLGLSKEGNKDMVIQMSKVLKDLN